MLRSIFSTHVSQLRWAHPPACAACAGVRKRCGLQRYRQAVCTATSVAGFGLASERPTTDAESAHNDEYSAFGATDQISEHQNLLCDSDKSPWAEFRAAIEPTGYDRRAGEEKSSLGIHPLPRKDDCYRSQWASWGPELKETWQQ